MMCLRRSSLFDIQTEYTVIADTDHFRLWHIDIQKSTLCYCQHRCIQALCLFCISYNMLVFWRTIYLSNKIAVYMLQALKLQ